MPEPLLKRVHLHDNWFFPLPSTENKTSDEQYGMGADVKINDDDSEETKNDKLDLLITLRAEARERELQSRLKEAYKDYEKPNAKRPNPDHRHEYGDEDEYHVSPPAQKRRQIFFENCVIGGCGGVVRPCRHNAKGIYFCDEHKAQHKKRPIKKN
jgi:hypothetical protein